MARGSHLSLAMIQRPLTERERLAVRLNRAAFEALFRWRMPTEIRGFNLHPCPGPQAFHHPCRESCGKSHMYHLTNHPHDDQS
jgi:hypothetical protein